MEACDLSRVTEAISVDKIRHMWWLADLITATGGKQTMEHKKLDFDGDNIKGQLQRQIALETESIELYTNQIAEIDDEEVVGVLKHILDKKKDIEKNSGCVWKH